MIALATADNLNISGLLFSPFTVISVFCKVKTDINASIKLMFRSSFMRISDVFFDFFKLTEAMTIFKVVYAAMEMAGIILIATFFLLKTMSANGITSARFMMIIKMDVTL